ncbi:hypothetical protein PPSIR1_14305 [Plesiocystis pacifica SIR-1]|uniref:VWFA domain-containing protein n=1 Tax=Plesiocystis pacifica SIR-1 TaxID=391625 RepID=A6GH39_9BACT|nr:hypothetical protein [Plesiocystis pacifica]EDM74817.1 hypothetical protein PPSIR1_14305 [Plesiocystis pacifica SIR-1]
MDPDLRLLALPLTLALVAACTPDNDAGSVFTDGSITTAGDEVGTDEAEDGEDGSSGSSSDDNGDGVEEEDEEDSTSSGGGPKLDTLPSELEDEGNLDEDCDFVDILFVIDNSVSMGGYQQALGLAMPQFATTLAEALPEDTNVHVAVTSTEMGFASGGTTSISNGECVFTGDGMPNSAFYVTPDMQNTGKNGAQGRLFDPGGGQFYASFDVNDGQAGADALAQWFSSASAIGTGGSNIEMSTGPAGWAFDPANTATNQGFMRDEGAVLLVFFVTDEPDQTPINFGGEAIGQAMLDKVAQAKAGCGGLDCVLAGGFLLDNPCNDQVPLDTFVNGMSEPPQIAELPDDNLPPQQIADQMNQLLSNSLADVIAQKCDEIPPVG